MLMALPSYHFSGEIRVPAGQEYTDGYLDFAFEVPAGVEALRLHLEYAPLRVGTVDNLFTPALYDPNGFRGNAHRPLPYADVVVGMQQASPGFASGPITPGPWLAQLAVHTVVADSQPCAYRLDIDMFAETGLALPAAAKPLTWEKASARSGWLKGELHSHTVHSDGSLTLAELLEQARRRGLDFLALTDHNTNTALAEITTTAQGGLLLIPGIELTTFHGHALALGVERWIDWRTGYQGRSMQAAAAEVHALGGVFILAHPNDIGSPYCTGCHWEYDDFDLARADALEIWNNDWGGTFGANARNLAQWQNLQQEPRHFPATGGGDYHSAHDWRPGTCHVYIRAESHTVEGILDGLRQGRVVVSGGPRLDLCAADENSGSQAGIGESIRAGGEISLQVDWDQAPAGASLVVRGRQGPIQTWQPAAQGTVRTKLQPQPGDRYWVEMYTVEGLLTALTNPVYIA